MTLDTNPTLTDARLDRLMAEVLAERAEDVYAAALTSPEMAERIFGRPRLHRIRRDERLGARSLALLALVGLLAAAALAAFVIGSWRSPPTSQLAIAEQIVEAINSRNPEVMRSLLTADGVLAFPAIDTRGGGEGQVYMTDRTVSEAFDAPYSWMAILDDYWGGMEADLRSCRSIAASTITCVVRTRWRTLQIEIGEAWTFEFDGERVRHLAMLRVDPDPPERVLPLGLTDLSAWEAWLREAHPALADRLLFEDNGIFEHLYFRYDWTNPDEIGDSIREYREVNAVMPASSSRSDPVPDERMTVVRQQVEAIDARDTDAFIDAFAIGAVFGPGGDFQASSSLFANSLPLVDASLVEAWMAINDAWGFGARIIACSQDPDDRIVYGFGEGHGNPMVVGCDVATRRSSLSLETTERWRYEFHGSELGHWEFAALDLNPSERALPLGYDGLLAWEAWLETTDPGAAARYLNPREVAACDGCDPLTSTAENDWSISGHRFAPRGLIPYDPANAAEIQASIQEFLRGSISDYLETRP